MQRWLRSAGIVGTDWPRTVRLKQQGRFRQKPGQPRMPIAVAQYDTTDPPGFVWVGTITMARCASILGRDKYVARRGDMDIRVLGLLRVVLGRAWFRSPA